MTGDRTRTARVINIGKEQFVRIPKKLRIAAAEVRIHKDAVKGNIVLSESAKGGSWVEFFALRDKTRMPRDFMDVRPMNRIATGHDSYAPGVNTPIRDRLSKTTRKVAPLGR